MINLAIGNLQFNIGENRIFRWVSRNADFKAKLERLIEVKNIDPGTVHRTKWQEDLKSELIRYKGAVETGKAEETVLFFCNPLGKEKMDFLNSKLSEWSKTSAG